MEQGMGIAYLLVGLVVGVAAGVLYMIARNAKTLNELVSDGVQKIRDRTIADTKTEIKNTLTLELEPIVREDLGKKLSTEVRQEAEKAAKRVIEDAEDKAANRVKDAELEAKNVQQEMRKQAEIEIKEKRQELDKAEQRLSQRDSHLDTRDDKLSKRDADLEARDKKHDEMLSIMASRDERIKEREASMEGELEKIAGYTAEQARQLLIDNMAGDAKIEGAKLMRQIEEEAIEEGDKKAKKIIATAIARWSGEYVAERAVTVVPLPTDELKGRIIGREGRNIRALEAATGVDFIIDDTPEAVVISCFDPVKRHIARLTLEKLISDGRIHPSRIEEIVAKATDEVDAQIKDFGERAAFELGIHGLHIDLIKLVGRLQFRTSYGQNMWTHSIEVGFLCGLMAAELGINVKQARRAGLLHDIGKALTHEQDGSHALIGAEIAKRCGEHEIVRNAIAAHHNEEPQNSVIAHLVIAGDALSGARPGARREILGTYIRRLEDLERISLGFEGVEKSYAVQAGREIRVMVENHKVNDDQAYILSKEIARKIEEDMTYPGQIKVCVIRETRAVEYAK
jgi:ribonuclease Y